MIDFPAFPLSGFPANDPPMHLSKEEVKHIADLARLDLAGDEQADFSERLSSVLEFVHKLGEVDTEGIEPMSHSIELHNTFREDEVAPRDDASRAAIVEAFPDREDDLLKVKAVFS